MKNIKVAAIAALLVVGFSFASFASEEMPIATPGDATPDNAIEYVVDDEGVLLDGPVFNDVNGEDAEDEADVVAIDDTASTSNADANLEKGTVSIIVSNKRPAASKPATPADAEKKEEEEEEEPQATPADATPADAEPENQPHTPVKPATPAEAEEVEPPVAEVEHSNGGSGSGSSVTRHAVPSVPTVTPDEVEEPQGQPVIRMSRTTDIPKTGEEGSSYMDLILLLAGIFGTAGLTLLRQKC